MVYDKEAVYEIVVKVKTKDGVSQQKETSREKCSTCQADKKPAPTLGIIRLDYDYPPAPGDIDHPDSYPYDVFYKVVPGFTFEMCQSGKLTDQVEEDFKKSIKWLVEEKKVSAITGDCGFMMYFQELARSITHIPVFMSSLCQLPAVTCAYSSKEQIIIMTANGQSLEPMTDLIKDECGVEMHEKRYHIVGCESAEYFFEAVEKGHKVDTEKAQDEIVELAKKSLEKYPDTRAFLLECTELPPYSDAIRQATGLPVFDAITASNFFMAGFLDDVRFGLNDWQHEWDQVQDEYKFGDNLREFEKKKLVNPVVSDK